MPKTPFSKIIYGLYAELKQHKFKYWTPVMLSNESNHQWTWTIQSSDCSKKSLSTFTYIVQDLWLIIYDSWFWTWQNACMNASMDVIDCIKIKFVWSTLFQWTKWTIEIRFDPSLVIQVISICFTRIKNVIMHNCLNQNLRITYYSLFMRHKL